MAYRRVRCNTCNSLLQVSFEAQAIRCPLCRNISYLQPQQNINAYNPPPRRPPAVSAPSPKRAVICGISYRGHEKELKSSIGDVRRMQGLLIKRFGFPNEAIVILTEDEPDPRRVPTKSNIQAAMRWLVQGCQTGDSLVFYYTGHASRVRDFNNDEMDGYDEALCPLDYHTEGKILDDEINATIVRLLPFGAKLHAVVDTCFSGTLLDLPFMCRMDTYGYYNWDDHRIPYSAYKGSRGGKAVCFSACDDQQTTGDTTAFTGIATGALTFSFIHVVEAEYTLTYGHLLNAMRRIIFEAKKPYAPQAPQEPQFSSSEQFDIHSETFAM